MKAIVTYKWRLLALLFVAFFIELCSRQLYGAALPQIRLEFLKYGVTNAQLGAVGTVFGAVFGLSMMASGLAADLLGRKRVLVAGTLFFSVVAIVLLPAMIWFFKRDSVEG